MNKIKQYQLLLDIKIDTQKLVKPFDKSSPQRIYFNLNELKLYYDPLTKTYKKKYLPNDQKDGNGKDNRGGKRKRKKGGLEKNISFIEFTI